MADAEDSDATIPPSDDEDCEVSPHSSFWFGFPLIYDRLSVSRSVLGSSYSAVSGDHLHRLIDCLVTTLHSLHIRGSSGLAVIKSVTEYQQ